MILKTFLTRCNYLGKANAYKVSSYFWYDLKEVVIDDEHHHSEYKQSYQFYPSRTSRNFQ